MKEFLVHGHVAAYHMKAPNLAVAAVAIMLVGHGKYGVTQIGEPKESLPILRHKNQADAWAMNRFGMTMHQVESRVARDFAPALVETLLSLKLGMPGDGDLKVRPRTDIEPLSRRAAEQVQMQLVSRIQELELRKSKNEMIH